MNKIQPVKPGLMLNIMKYEFINIFEVKMMFDSGTLVEKKCF